MSKQPKQYPKNDIYRYKSAPGIPKGNVLDLRQTKLGNAQFSDTEKLIIQQEKEEAKLAKKSEKNQLGFFAAWKIERQKNKQARQVRKEHTILEKKAAKEAITQIKLVKEQAKQEKNKTKDNNDNIDNIVSQQKLEKPIEKSKKQKTKLSTKPQSFDSLSPRLRWKLSVKPLTLFLAVCFIMILPFACLALYQKLGDIKVSVMSLSSQALEDIKVGSQLASDFNFGEASSQFSGAFTKFNEAEEELGSINQAISTMIEVMPGKGQEYKSAKYLLSAASNLSSAAENLTLAVDVYSKLNGEVLKNVNEENPPALTDVLVMGHVNLQPASEKINQAVSDFEQVAIEDLPIEYQEQIETIKTELPKLNSSLKQILSLSETMLTILGHDEAKRYLVVFQNNREIRATGGFLGSFGLIDIEKGEAQKMVIPGGGTYDLNGALKAKIKSPEPLHLINPVWQIQDANWWPDWPTSARKIEWFYSQSDGPTVDGVLALTPDVIEKMLSITGPIDMSQEYDVVITAENFYEVIQSEAERKYDETQESKKIIADLTPRLLDKLFSLEKESALSVLEVFYQALREKDILLYFNDELLEQEIVNLGWSGSIKDTPGDYLNVINTNIGGGKTDAVIEEIINHKAEIDAGGNIIDTVTITRTHKGSPNDTFANVLNWDYLRLYVPEGSQLISAEGFEQPDKNLILDVPSGYELDNDLKNISGDVYIEDNTKMRINKEFGKTVFGNWIKTEPGQSSTITISYKLPFTIETDNFLNNTDTYSLLVQKQAGSFDSLFNTQLIVDDSYEMKWRYPNDWEGNYDTVLDSDKYLGVVLAK